MSGHFFDQMRMPLNFSVLILSDKETTETNSNDKCSEDSQAQNTNTHTCIWTDTPSITRNASTIIHISNVSNKEVPFYAYNSTYTYISLVRSCQ